MSMKVAIYCRLSEEDRNKQSAADDSESIQNQKSMLVSYAVSQGWEIYNIYSDDDYTGADRMRPEFNRMISDAQAHCFDIILCKTQSRFTRELEIVEKYIHGLFPIWGIRFVSIVDNADTDVKGNKKSRQINGLVNEWYLEDMSESIRSVLTDKRKKGLHIGSFALYGYQKDPEAKGHLIIDEEAAAVVREVFTLFSQGYGKTAIARILNDRGIPNPTEYKRQKGLRYKGPDAGQSTLWKYFAIADMLNNEIYIGNMVQGKYGCTSYKTHQNRPRPKDKWYRVEGTHEAIIDRELWDKVQVMLKERAKPFVTGKIGLFAQKTKCKYCGYTLRSCVVRNTHYLKCPNRHISQESCPGSFISVDRLERYVLKELRRLADTYLDRSMLEQYIELDNNELKGRMLTLENNISSYQKKITEYSNGIRELYLDKVKGIITESEYLEFKANFDMEKKRLEQLVMDERRKLIEINDKLAAGDNKKRIIEQYVNLEHLDREIVEILIDYVVVGRRIPGTKEVPVEIHWNF